MKTVRERIFDKCEPVPESGCWLWTGAMFNHGKPQIRLDGRLMLASRASYEAFKGPIGDLFVCHKCDTPQCVNPDHLFIGTHADNMADRNRKGRQARLHGETSGTARLTDGEIRAIRTAYAGGSISTESLGREYGVTGRQIRYIVRGKAWPHIACAPGAATLKAVA